MRSLKMLPAYIMVCVLACTSLSAQMHWKHVGDLQTRRAFPVVLPISKNAAIVMGGWKTGVFSAPTETCEIVTTNGPSVKIAPAASMHVARAEFQAYLLGDTAVIVFSGFGLAQNPTEIEVYDIRKNTWTVVGRLQTGRRQHIVLPLPNQRFVIAGGRLYGTQTLQSAELFDLKTGVTTAIPDYPYSINGAIGSSTSMGTPVALGGRNGGHNGSRSPNIYTFDDVAGAWKQIGSMPSGREASTYTKLRDGRLVIIGGSASESPARFLDEILVEMGGDFTLAGTVPTAPIYCGVAEDEDDIVVVAGGFNDLGQNLRKTAFLNVSSGTAILGPELNFARRYTRAASLVYEEFGQTFRTVIVVAGADNNGAMSSVEMLIKSECDPNAPKLTMLDHTSKTNPTGTAVRLGNIVRLTDTVKYSAGALWSSARYNVERGFSTNFTFTMQKGNDNAQMDGSSPGADGVSFVLQTAGPRAVGKFGQGVGYDDMPNCLAVEFDSYFNFADSDPNGSHCAVQSGKDKKCRGMHQDPYMLAISSAIPELKADGLPYYCRVEYTPGRLAVYINRSGLFGEPTLVVNSFKIEEIIPLGQNNSAFLGFTSATGFSVEQHDIVDWTIEACTTILTDVEPDESTSLEPGLSCYPLPVQGKATILSRAFVGKVNCSLVDVSGRVVRAWTCSSDDLSMGSVINLEFVEKGVYVLHLSDGVTTESLTLPILP